MLDSKQGDDCPVLCSLILVSTPQCTVSHRSGFAGEQVPTLYEALDLCKKLDLLMFLELKEDTEKVSGLAPLCAYFTIAFSLVCSFNQETVFRGSDSV